MGVVFRVFFCVCLMTTLLAAPQRAYAGWPSTEDVMKVLMKAAGLDPDEVEAVKFSIKEPACASTIVSYTAAQDYSLVGFIAALKTMKMDNVPGLPKMSGPTCKSYNPVQRAYAFIDNNGNKLLGKTQADYFRTLLSEQIQEGKSEIDQQIAAIPYVGTILSNWDCECDAAFETNFQMEKIVNDKVGLIISIGQRVGNEDYSGALELMVKGLGPDIACELGAKWTGVDSVPIVNDIAASACSSVVGKPVEWVVSGAGAIAEAAGIVGYDHMDPQEYFKGYVQYVGKPDWREWMPILYKKCYNYFEPSNMSASTAKKACLALQQQFADLNEGGEQKVASSKDPAYGKTYLDDQMQNAIFMSDTEFSEKLQALDAGCEAYMAQTYPKIKPYEKFFATENFPFDPTYCDFGFSMEKARKKKQDYYVYELRDKLVPLCQHTGKRNEIVCEGGKPLNACKAQVPETCIKASGGGWQKPCCLLGTGMDNVFKNNADYAYKLAREVGGDYCTTNNDDPLKIDCALKEAYEACQKKFSYETNKDCAKANKSPFGVSMDLCCEHNPDRLPNIKGVKEAATFTLVMNMKNKGDACGIGGMQEGLSYDPRIVHCRADLVEECKKELSSSCKKGAAGFVDEPCCDVSIFQAVPEEDRPYDPAGRSEEELAMTAKAVEESHGKCHYSEGPDGKEDKFKVVCDTLKAGEMCLKTLDRPAKTPCSKKMSENGWVTSPCCERSPKALQAGVRDSDVKDGDIKAPSAGKSLGDMKAQDTTAGQPHKKPLGGLAGRRKDTDSGLKRAAKPKRATSSLIKPRETGDGAGSVRAGGSENTDGETRAGDEEEDEESSSTSGSRNTPLDMPEFKSETPTTANPYKP